MSFKIVLPVRLLVQFPCCS